MILLDGERLGCEQCIRGHRAADCQHLGKHLISIKGRGRPAAKDESIRYRIAPNPKIIKTSYEPIESKNGRGKSGTKKFCYHLDPDTAIELYKVKLGKGFKVIGPVKEFKYQNSFKVRPTGQSQPQVEQQTATQGSSIHQMHPQQVKVEEQEQAPVNNGSVFAFPHAITNQLVQMMNRPRSTSNTLSSSVSPTNQNFSVPPTPVPSPNSVLTSREGSRVLEDMFDANSRPSFSSDTTANSYENMQPLLQNHQFDHPMTVDEITFLQQNGALSNEQVFRLYDFNNSGHIHHQQHHQAETPKESSSASQTSHTATVGTGNEHENGVAFGHEYFIQNFLGDAISEEPHNSDVQWPAGFGNDGLSRF